MKIQTFFDKFDGCSLTYNDLIFHPAFVDFPPDAISLKTKITRNTEINIPVASSPMDTVTEGDLAIGLALQGGMGFIHYNMSPEQQKKQIQKVKRFKSGFVTDPLTLPPTSKIRDVVAIREDYGYTTIPITEDGMSHSRLVGMITKYDYSTLTEEDLNKTVSERMIPVEELTIATFEELSVGGALDIRQANARLVDSHSAALPIVDREGNLIYFITRSDLEKYLNCPNATSDSSKRLKVGAAIETWPERAYERLEAVGSDIDVIVFDTSQGHTSFEIELIRWVKSHYPDLQVIGGNVVTEEGCRALIEAGADGIRVGMGSGSICTTQDVGGVGRGQATAVYRCARLCSEYNVPLIADGGISKSADIIKALCLGASAVMLGSLLACTDEAPGKMQIKNGIKIKEYRGMGSLKAMELGSAARYEVQKSELKVPEGVEGMVSSRGSILEWVPCLMQGVRQGFHKLGMKGIRDIQNKIQANEIHLERRSEAAKREGGIHNLYDVLMDNYQQKNISSNELLVYN